VRTVAFLTLKKWGWGCCGAYIKWVAETRGVYKETVVNFSTSGATTPIAFHQVLSRSISELESDVRHLARMAPSDECLRSKGRMVRSIRE